MGLGLRYDLGVPVVDLCQLLETCDLQEIGALVNNWACTLYASEAKEKQNGDYQGPWV